METFKPSKEEAAGPESQEGIPILTEDQFLKAKEENGYIEGFHGTYKSPEKNSYLYIKPKFLLEAEEQTYNSLAALRYLTSKGILYPETRWGAFKTKKGEFQIFAVTKKLEAWNPEKNTESGRQKVSIDIGQDTSYQNIFAEGSHVLEWVRRIDPEFDPEQEPKNDFVMVLNPFEASHSDNWAWDENGKLYPIDIEVIDLNNAESQERISRWARSNPGR